MSKNLSRRQFTSMVLAALAVVLVVGQVEAKGAKAQEKAKEKIEQVYREVLGRVATEEDIDLHLNLLLSRELKPKDFRKAIVMSEECTAAVTRVFKQELGRDPNEKQLTKAKKGLAEGGTLERLRQELRR